MTKNMSIAALKKSVAPGLVVFLVALPLCLGIALASGAPPIAGIISGVVGGVIVGLLSNSNISVSGPAAGLAAIILGAITELGSFELLLTAGIIAGVLQVILGLLRSGTIANYFPSSVIEGMLAGIGLVILIKQLPLVFGVDALGDITSFASIQLGTVIITAISLAILLLWNKMKWTKKVSFLPAALIVVVVGILINQFWIATGSSLAIEPSRLVSIPMFDSLSDISSIFVFPDWTGFANPAVWMIGGTIAIVASIETLLCIEATDRLDPLKRHTDTNRELKVQGIGNILSSLIGGLPMTSVVVRSSANVNAGGLYKASAVIHGIFLLIAVISLPLVLNMIPLASLAAVLILVGYNLARPAILMHFWHKGYTQFIPFIITFIMVVVTDLLVGVLVGMGVSVLFLLIGNVRKAFSMHRQIKQEQVVYTLTLAEEVSFLNKTAIKNRLYQLPDNCHLAIDAKRMGYIHVDVLELIETFINEKAKEKNILITTTGFHKEVKVSGDQQNIILSHRKTI
ncbi:SulP family inorganic anion transporter [Myroides odoratimimus]|uniref:SulP family inorganic anion transporter n=1 Tax=Myroides odoratimimus TaxID=76832 RepID=UPI001CE05CD0|nr:SulP family inorganic anion transporter [Myroides odoratimimus]MCA4793220.1 SulP family inorganic anion transporter [Myroides odoratimimus]MCA4820378.1 SulP family inorganic anion transporter [Myroides odoratimimus]MDM1521313.1 SulP family inorganic anion transporter [Myroides odoratimimus]